MTASVPTERKPSLWEDLLEIFYAPTAVFERRRETPAFGLALLVLVVVLLGLTLAFRGIMEPVFDVEFTRNMAAAAAKNPQLTPERIAQAKAMAGKFLIPGVVGTWLILPLLLGLVYWVIGKVLDSKAQLGQIMMVAVYACFPRVIESILGALQLLVLPESSITSRYSITLGLGRFIDPANHLLLAILGRVDVFTLWITFLLGVGMAVMGRMPKGRAFVAAGLMWVVGAIPSLWGAVQAG
ncbi:MAG TPA: YIP1 family protein [Gemmatimonadales bacterium]|nr:YIP1 family protein [Gemmatimonadales bacterium]